MSQINVDTIKGRTGGAIGAPSGINVTGVATATNVSVGQSVTAATFHGDGSNLQGVSPPMSFDITSSLFM